MLTLVTGNTLCDTMLLDHSNMIDMWCTEHNWQFFFFLMIKKAA